MQSFVEKDNFFPWETMVTIVVSQGCWNHRRLVVLVLLLLFSNAPFQLVTDRLFTIFDAMLCNLQQPTEVLAQRMHPISIAPSPIPLRSYPYAFSRSMFMFTVSRYLTCNWDEEGDRCRQRSRYNGVTKRSECNYFNAASKRSNKQKQQQHMHPSIGTSSIWKYMSFGLQHHKYLVTRRGPWLLVLIDIRAVPLLTVPSRKRKVGLSDLLVI